eukprot:COSAG02_NODE_7040_length_3214_cov_2.032745_1_plen_66_part_00
MDYLGRRFLLCASKQRLYRVLDGCPALLYLGPVDLLKCSLQLMARSHGAFLVDAMQAIDLGALEE